MHIQQDTNKGPLRQGETEYHGVASPDEDASQPPLTYCFHILGERLESGERRLHFLLELTY